MSADSLFQIQRRQLHAGVRVYLGQGPELTSDKLTLLAGNTLHASQPLASTPDVLCTLSLLLLSQENQLAAPLRHGFKQLLLEYDSLPSIAEQSSDRLAHDHPEAPTPQETTLNQELLESLSGALLNQGLVFERLETMADALDRFETSNDSLFSATPVLNSETRQKMAWLWTVLFNQRALTAWYLNRRAENLAFEAIHVDPFLDYLPFAEGNVNLVRLFHHQKQSLKGQPEALASCEKSLAQYFPEALGLYQHAPDHLIENTNETTEEGLFLYQMDWLFGSDAGLLFRLREELFGLQEGFDKVFWPQVGLVDALPPFEVTFQIPFEGSIREVA